jgi:hypothetical protein
VPGGTSSLSGECGGREGTEKGAETEEQVRERKVEVSTGSAHPGQVPLGSSGALFPKPLRPLP